MQTDSDRLAAAVARLDALSDWEKRPRHRMRPTLDPVRDLLQRLGHRQASAGVVHVAGSKGKGSVAALVAAGLWRAGRSVGTYASPHVERMNERVSIGGEPVSDGVLARSLERSLDVRRDAVDEGSAGREATWFDTVTASALLVFRDAGVEWVVAECGLGGRLDSTNVLSGDVCAVTNVELEHTAVLGDTRARIAAEKVGILGAGGVLATPLAADDEAGRVLAQRAAELGARLVRPQVDERAPIDRRNRALAGLILDELGRLGHLAADGAPLAAGRLDAVALERARLPGRMERRVVRGVPVVLDGAHTPGSVGAVLRDLGGAPGLPGRPTVVLGLAREKDLAGILKTLTGAVDRIHCTSVGTPLHRTPGEIRDRAVERGLVAETAATPPEALARALASAADGGGWVLAIGSLYLAGELRPLLR